MGKYLVGIDEGTMGCKTCIFDLEGNMVGYDYREYGCIFPKPGRVEQSGEELTKGLFKSCKEAIKQSGIDPKEIIAVGLSTQGGVVGSVDEEGNLIGNFIGWQDARCFETNPDITDKMSFEEYYEIEGWSIRGLMHPLRTHLWLLEHQPEFYELAARLVTNQEYFLRQFGVEGYFCDSSSACREGLADVDAHDYSPRIFEAFGMDINKRAKVVNNGTVVGHVPENVSELTGLAVGTPICVGALDQDCSTFGAGLIREGEACVVMGTFGACYVISEKPVRDPNEALIIKSHSKFENGPNTFTVEGMAITSASTFKWFRDQIGTMEVASAKMLGADPYELICNQAKKSLPGANGVSFLPYFQGCVAKGDSTASGAYVGIRLDTDRSDMARAVMEGITYEMLEIMKLVENAGVDIKSVKLAGGPTKSSFWCQMQADIYQKPIEIVQTPETGCLGAALYAGVGTGVYKDAYEAVEKAVHVVKTFQPNTETKVAYEEAFKKFNSVYNGLNSTAFGIK